MPRYTRLPNGFSKKLEHAAATALHFMHYNFARIHRTIRCSPAMRGGVTETLWTIRDIVGLLEERRPQAPPESPNLTTTAGRLTNSGLPTKQVDAIGAGAGGMMMAIDGKRRAIGLEANGRSVVVAAGVMVALASLVSCPANRVT